MRKRVLTVILILIMIFCCAYDSAPEEVRNEIPENPILTEIKDYFSRSMEKSVYKDVKIGTDGFGFPPIPGMTVVVMCGSVGLMFLILGLILRGRITPNAEDHGETLWINSRGKEKSLITSYIVHQTGGNAFTTLGGSKDASEIEIHAALTDRVSLSQNDQEQLKKFYKDTFSHAARYKNRPLFLEETMESLDTLVDEKFCGNACSAVIVDLFQNRLYWSCVGNSLLCLIRENGLIRLNRTHTRGDLAALEFLRGDCDEAQYLERRNDRNLTSSLGCGDMPEVDRNVLPFKILPGDELLMLSTSGMEELSDDVILKTAESIRSGQFCGTRTAVWFGFKAKGGAL